MRRIDRKALRPGRSAAECLSAETHFAKASVVILVIRRMKGRGIHLSLPQNFALQGPD